jgi:HEAT repeat-containing protein 5
MTLYYLLTVRQTPLLRYHSLLALRKSMTTAKRAITDSLAKDILKQTKYGLYDKSLAIQRVSAEVYHITDNVLLY